MKKSIIFQFLLLQFLFPFSASAQLSPGDLHEAHSQLEGLKNCEVCHEAGRQILPSKCLDCHSLLKQRIDSDKGLHSNEGYDDCVACHVEHLGREAEMIWWPNEIYNFDHKQTGYQLTGKHVVLECRKCHIEKNIRNKERLLSSKKNLNRSFLGLNVDCLNCHEDRHAGQLDKNCDKCHSTKEWKPPSEFDHAKTAYSLSGKHRELDCSKCHRPISDNQSAELTILKFKNIAHNRCSDCHQDNHKGKFKERCETCHNSSGWHKVNRAGFDHNKTKFGLLGKHQNLPCEKCHIPGKSISGLKFDLCKDCHSDYHKGAFAKRSLKGECGECHKVNGFALSFFTVEGHQKTDYPLQGNHLAIPCLACHLKSAEIENQKEFIFAFESSSCNACHKNPHDKAVNKYLDRGGCEYCHNVSGWRSVSFDHKETKFELESKHAQIKCAACHKPVEGENSVESLNFEGLSKDCLSCHTDVHRSQFAESKIIDNVETKTTNCQKCHTPGNWMPDLFDHNRDSDFKLEGAHLKVKCYGCHKRTIEKDGSFIWFRPLEKTCKSCHGDVNLNLEAGEKPCGI